MFIGHFAVGMAGKRLAPKASLPVLFLAAQFADTLWPILVAARFETVRIVPGDTKFTPLEFVSYPWSHSLLMLIVWGLLFGYVYLRRTGDVRGSRVIAGLVVSHWVLDFITHRADMPVWPGGPKVGLSLWSHPTANIVLEVLLFGAGVAIYEGTTKGKNKRGQISFWLMVLFLVFIYAMSSGGTPPPNLRTLVTITLALMIVMLALAWYVDRNRTLEHPESSQSGRTRTRSQPFY